jgi:LEA14-like dessication related protein
MSGDREDAIGLADTDAINIKKSVPKRSGAPPKKKGWSTMRKVTVISFIIFLLIVIPIGATLQMPAVDVVGAKIQVTGSGLQKTYTFDAIIRVANPNMVSATVTHITGKFYINDVYGGDFEKTDAVTIVAQGTTDFPVDVKILNVVPIHLNADNAVRVKGTVTIQGTMTSWEVPFDETRNVHVP